MWSTAHPTNREAPISSLLQIRKCVTRSPVHVIVYLTRDPDKTEPSLPALVVSPPLNMSENNALYVTTFCAVVFLALFWSGRRNGTKTPFPPGPRGLPLLGNILDVPRDVPIWQTFTAVAKKFSTCPLAFSLNTLLNRLTQRQRSDLFKIVYKRIRRPEQPRGYIRLD